MIYNLNSIQLLGVQMKELKGGIKAGREFSNNSGCLFTVVFVKSSRMVTVLFKDTGFVCKTMAHNIRAGAVKDLMSKSVLGVGFLGLNSKADGLNKSESKAYAVWHSMLARCYGANREEENPSYAGCTVCDLWLNYSNFLQWFISNYTEGLHLDKDILIDGNKEYSPLACKFVTMSENSIKATAGFYSAISPLGNAVEFYNMSEFCRENGLTQSNMSKVISGKRESHKGWTRDDK